MNNKELYHKYSLWFVLLVLFSFGFYIFYKIDGIMNPFLIGLLGGYAFHAPMKRIEKCGMPRGLGAIFLITLIFGFLGIFLSWVVPFIRSELMSLIKVYPLIEEKFMNWGMPLLESVSKVIKSVNLKDIQAQFSDHFGQIFKWGINFIISLFSNGFALANILSMIILTPLIMFYFLKDWDKVINKVDGLLPCLYADAIRRLCGKVHAVLSAYITGQLYVCIVLIVSYVLLLSLIGLPQGPYIGFLTGFLAFIPYLGITIGFLLSITVAMTHASDMTMAFHVLAIFAAMGLIEGYILTPRLIGERIGLHPIFIIFALLALGSWLGITGILFALPLAAIIATLVRSFLSWYRHKYV
ncbi:MAG: hypothetical protein CNLJKLNK_00175 [Holosporales bacterium]